MAAVAGLWPRAARRPREVEPSVFGGIQVGVQSYTFRAFDIDRMIAAMTLDRPQQRRAVGRAHLAPDEDHRGRLQGRAAASSTTPASR